MFYYAAVFNSCCKHVALRQYAALFLPSDGLFSCLVSLCTICKELWSGSILADAHGTSGSRAGGTMHDFFILKMAVMRAGREENERVEGSVLASIKSGALLNELSENSRLLGSDRFRRF